MFTYLLNTVGNSIFFDVTFSYVSNGLSILVRCTSFYLNCHACTNATARKIFQAQFDLLLSV